MTAVSRPRTPYLRRVGAAAVLAGTVAALSACGSSTDETASPSAGAPSAEASVTQTSVTAPTATSAPKATTDPAQMKCSEYVTLDEPQQIAVLRANGATASDENVQMVARVLNITSCQVWPDMLVADVMAGKTGD